MTGLPQAWAVARLEEVAGWSSGGTPKAGTSEYYGGPVPWAIIGDLNDGRVSTTASTITEAGLANSSAKVVGPGTVLVAMYGSIGKLGIADIAMATNQAIACAVPNELVTREWLFWWLRFQRHELLAAGKGGTQTNISQTVLKAWPIPLAPRSEQERIVAAIEEAFSKLDAGEAGLRTVRRLLKRMRDAVLSAAVTGRLVPQDPTDIPAAKLLADLGVERASEPPEDLPATWTTVRLGDLVSEPLANGKSVRSRPGGFPVLRLTCLKGGGIDLAERKDGDWEARDAASVLVHRGDFFVSRGNGSLNLVGRGGLVVDEPDPVAYPDTLIRVRLPAHVLAPALLALVWNAPIVREQLEPRARTTAGIYKVNQSITWLRDDSLDDASTLPAPGVLAAEIVEELEAALAQFSELAASLPVEVSSDGDVAE